ncbi:MAG: hypothetical protein ACPLXP_02460 [Microgenomates group bacterium]
MEIINQDFENIPTWEGQVGEKVPPISKKLFIFGGVFLGILLVMILLRLFFRGLPQQLPPPAQPTPTPTPTPFLSEEITNPSFYATDSAVLKIEEDLKKIDRDLESTELKESNLNPPVLDWEIRI